MESMTLQKPATVQETNPEDIGIAKDPWRSSIYDLRVSIYESQHPLHVPDDGSWRLGSILK
jgi:hypothetical protein